MFLHEDLWGNTVERGISISLARVHIRTSPDLKMEMRQISTVCCAHRAYLLPTEHIPASLHEDRVQVSIHGLHHRAQFVTSRQAMRYNDHLSPPAPRASSIYNPASTCCVDRISQV